MHRHGSGFVRGHFLEADSPEGAKSGQSRGKQYAACLERELHFHPASCRNLILATADFKEHFERES
jgi:dynactin complex subunit